MIQARQIPYQVAEKLQNTLAATRREALAVSVECASGTVKLGDLVTSRLQAIIHYRTEIVALSQRVGMATAYAAMYPSDAFDFAAEITKITTAMQEFVDFVVTQIPKNGTFLSIVEFDTDRKIKQRTTSAAAPLANIKAKADVIVNLIDV